MTQAFAFGFERKRLVWSKWKTTNVFVKNFAGLVYDSNGGDLTAFDLRWR
ncbi:MAG TPA: hypothetical protein VNY30_02680 [Bryobacteraceae bacterium]|nr:hypothetical protein [Bryobacteraceae bacterium]